MTAMTKFDLKSGMKTLFVFGGSQGSEALNTCMEKMVNVLENVQVIWQTGKNNFHKYEHFNSGSVRVLPFIDDMPSAYALSDLTLSRAGALTIAELTACGKPGVYVPLPTAAADHQTHNACSIANAGAGELVHETELAPEKTAQLITNIISDDDRLYHMAHSAKNLGKPEATKMIVDTILEKVLA